ncbi:MAG: Nucleotidyl transferase [Gammaproteobacteria bacterium]|nr:Nucleotidyl transferase [Gammaproteobacteria bacterium]
MGKNSDAKPGSHFDEYQKPMKAMILAAGLGKRMGNLTKDTPKPLLQVRGKPLIVWQIENLVKAGIDNIVINVSHLSQQIQGVLGNGSQWGIHIIYSVEATPLETGGGIVKALPYLGDKPFIVTSSDLFTDYPFERLMNKTPVSSHLVLVDNPPFHPHGDYALKEGYVCLKSEPKLNYAGIGVFHPDLFANQKPGVLRLSMCLEPAIESKIVSGEYYAGVWHNIGSPEQLALCNAA